MPIAQLKPTAPIPDTTMVDPTQVIREKDIYSTATVDNAVHAPQSMLAYMEGMAWPVDYYSQVVSKHDDIREVDIGQHAALQQYTKISLLELRVQSELSQSYDNETGLTTVTGNAVIIQVIPNQYDYFVTAASVTERALFMVTSVERKTYNNQSVYQIEYTMVGYIDSPTVQARYTALEDRTIREFVFNKERLANGASPLLTKDDHHAALQLQQKLSEMVQQYYQFFNSALYRLLLVPDRDRLIYDPRLAEFFRSVVDSRLLPDLHRLNYISMDKEFYLSKESILTCLRDRTPTLLNSALPKVGLMARAHFRTNSFLGAANCWAIEYFAYPDFADTVLKARYETRGHKLFNPSGLLEPWTDPYTQTENPTWVSSVVDLGDGVISLTKPVHQGGYYLFSQALYEGIGALSLMEKLVLDYLHQRPLNLKHLVVVVQDYEHWPSLEMYYYGPILFLLIQEAIHGFY